MMSTFQNLGINFVVTYSCFLVLKDTLNANFIV
jgi:hypothetical protein